MITDSYPNEHIVLGVVHHRCAGQPPQYHRIDIIFWPPRVGAIVAKYVTGSKVAWPISKSSVCTQHGHMRCCITYLYAANMCTHTTSNCPLTAGPTLTFP